MFARRAAGAYHRSAEGGGDGYRRRNSRPSRRSVQAERRRHLVQRRPRDHPEGGQKVRRGRQRNRSRTDDPRCVGRRSGGIYAGDRRGKHDCRIKSSRYKAYVFTALDSDV